MGTEGGRLPHSAHTDLSGSELGTVHASFQQILPILQYHITDEEGMALRGYMIHLIMTTTNVSVKILQGDRTNTIYVCIYITQICFQELAHGIV